MEKNNNLKSLKMNEAEIKNNFYNKLLKGVQSYIENIEEVKDVKRVIDPKTLNDNVFSISIADSHGNWTKSFGITVERY